MMSSREKEELSLDEPLSVESSEDEGYRVTSSCRWMCRTE